MKNTKTFDIFLYLGAFLLTVAMIAVLFNLKWAQNARKLAEEQSLTASETESGNVGGMIDTDVTADMNESGVSALAEAGNGANLADFSDSADSAEIVGTETTDDANESLKGLTVRDDDVIFFLGGDFSLLQQRFASSEQILGAESHYFVDEYLGVVYDENTMEIMCLENDGPGKMPIKLAGLSIGMSREEFMKLLEESDIDYTESEEENTVKFNWHADETIKYKAEIEFEDDEIIDIICRVR